MIFIPSPRMSTSLEAIMLGQWFSGRLGVVSPSLADPNAGRSGSPALTAAHCSTEKAIQC